MQTKASPAPSDVPSDVPIIAGNQVQASKPPRPKSQPAPRDEAETIARSPRQFMPKEKAASPSPVVLHTIDLDLKSRRQRHELGDSKARQLRILALKDCKTRYALSPEDGRFDEKSDALVAIDGPREIVLRVGLNSSAADKSVIVVDARATTDAGDEIPFTLANIQRIRARIVQEGKRATSELEAIQGERQQLQAWIAAPVAKPLAARGQARARIAELELAIAPQAELVATLEADFKVAEAMHELAADLHRRCQIQIGSAD